MRFTVSYQPTNRVAVSGDSLANLRALSRQIDQIDSVQIRVEKFASQELEAGLSAYFNAHRAWIMWMNTDGDFLYPINPNWRELEYDREECFIENGQLDEYEIGWSTPKTEAIALLAHYFERGELAPWLQWTDEQYWE